AWISRYSFAERQALVAQTGNRNIFRTAFDVYNDASNQMSLTVTVQDGYLAFVWHVSDGKGTYYFVLKGTEDALFGRDVSLAVSLSWDGFGTSTLSLNGKVAQTLPYGRSRASWTNASFAIGASDRRSFGGGFFCSDDAIANFTVRNTGRLPLPPPKITVASPKPGQTVGGSTTIQAAAVSDLAVSTVSLLVDGAAAATLNAYPYRFPWNTRRLRDGEHQLELVATDALGGVSRLSWKVTVRNDAAAADTQPPDPVSGFRTDAISASEIRFAWSPAEDNVGVASYEIYRDGALAGAVTAGDGAPAYADAGRSPGAAHVYQVVAVDAAGNRSALSSPLALITKKQDGRILRVGPEAAYAKPCAAIAAAAPFDTVEIDAAGNDTYDGDVCQFRVDDLTIRGVNG